MTCHTIPGIRGISLNVTGISLELLLILGMNVIENVFGKENVYLLKNL